MRINIKSPVLLILLLIGLNILAIYLNRMASMLGDAEALITSQLPENSLLRDFKKLEGVTPESYMAIYVEEGYQVGEPQETYFSCPGAILGRSIKGNYHVILYQKGGIVNEVAVPPAYTGVPLELVYQNSKENLYQEGEYAPDQRNDLEEVNLIDLQDYTGDGQNYEFLLTTTFGGCGFYDSLAVGYDPENRQVVVYSGWLPRFSPNSQGESDYLFACGDHGNETRVERKYSYNPQTKRFEILWNQETPCDL